MPSAHEAIPSPLQPFWKHFWVLGVVNAWKQLRHQGECPARGPLNALLWVVRAICVVLHPWFLPIQNSKRKEEKESEREAWTCWAIRLKGSEQPTMLQCCLCIFLVAGIWSKTSGENSLHRKYHRAESSSQESNPGTKSSRDRSPANSYCWCAEAGDHLQHSSEGRLTTST